MHFFFRLHPPRPDFATTLSAEEGAAMQAHGVYWTGLMERGRAVVFGLVGDPAGPYGVAIANLPDDVDPRAVADADPAIRAAIGLRYEIHPMPLVSAPG